ncbi:hypothetical protein ACFRJ1_23360 [Streptomyces sp. NPDC056773]|uniref:hypothetical protein n=1 Tax=unclassified Streptomyces TaxID=2593676 RepID=UPI003684CA20
MFQDAKAAFGEHRPVLDQVARSAARLRGAAPEAARRTALTTLGELCLPEPLAGRRSRPPQPSQTGSRSSTRAGSPNPARPAP